MIKILMIAFGLFCLVRNLLQLKNLAFGKFLITFFYLSFLLFLLSEFLIYPKFSELSLGAFAGASFALVVLTIVENINAKKNRVLWRIPVITALIAYHFSLSEVLLGAGILELVLTVFLYQFKENYLFAYRQQVKVFILVLVQALLSYYEFQTLWGTLLLIVLLKNQMINMLKLKLLMRDIS